MLYFQYDIRVHARMPLLYSLDLRWQVVWMHLVYQVTPGEIGELLGLSERMVKQYISTFQHTGKVQPKPRRSGPQKLMGEYEQLLLLQIIIRNPGNYLHEMQERLYERLGVTVSSSTLCRTLRSMGCTRQVIHNVAMQRDG